MGQGRPHTFPSLNSAEPNLNVVEEDMIVFGFETWRRLDI